MCAERVSDDTAEKQSCSAIVLAGWLVGWLAGMLMFSFERGWGQKGVENGCRKWDQKGVENGVEKVKKKGSKKCHHDGFESTEICFFPAVSLALVGNSFYRNVLFPKQTLAFEGVLTYFL